jgi:hypothetical protein
MADGAKSDSLEEALAATEADAQRAIHSANAALHELKKARTAAATGNLRELTKALESVRTLMADAHAEADRLVAGWQLDDRQHLESGAFTSELRQLAEARGLTIIEQDGRLLTYPSVIRVLPAETAVEIDRKRERKIRPSVLVEQLRAGQQKPPRLKVDQFVETLHKAYGTQLAREGKQPGATVRLLDIYSLLTPMPTHARDYSRQEFARDIYLLDSSGIPTTREGWKMSLRAATGTKGSGTLSTVTPDGNLKVYYSIAFDR